MGQGSLIEEELSRSVIGAFYEVYNELGFGYSEHVHVQGLARELVSRGHSVALEFPVDVFYKGELLCTQRLDLLVDSTLIVETKSSETLPPLAMRQLQNYLRCTNLEVGLLLHFGPAPKFYRRVVSNSEQRQQDHDQKNKGNPLRNDIERI